VTPDGLVHCPNCLTEYRRGISVCTECGFQVVDGPSPAMEEEYADDPNAAGDPVNAGRGQIEVVRLTAQASDAPAEDLFEQEERPTRVILCRIEEDDAAGLVEALDDEGIGARVGETFEDDTAEVIVHDTRLGEAQAIMVDYLGDPTLVDGVTFDNVQPPGADDPGRDGFIEVSSGTMSNVTLQANRLSDEGMRVRLVLPPEGTDPNIPEGWSSLYVAQEDLSEARAILGMEV
jgi:hypothetical protein